MKPQKLRLQTLRYLLLGFLSTRPRSGYSLRKSFFAPARPALSQIYRTLADMKEDGLVDFDRVEQEKVPDQKVYRITEAGSAELDRWLMKPVPLRVGRDTFLGQLWFSYRIDMEYIIRNIETYANDVRHQLEWFETEARPLIQRGAKPFGSPLHELYWNATVDCIVTQLEAWLKWADKTVTRFSEFHAQTCEDPVTLSEKGVAKNGKKKDSNSY